MARRGNSYAKLSGSLFTGAISTLSDDTFRALIRLATWSALWDYAGRIPKDAAPSLLGCSARKARRMLSELTRPAEHHWQAQVLIEEDDHWYLINPKLIPFGRDGESWDKSEAHKVLARDGHRCRYCERELSGDEITFDHVMPRSRGGGDKPENLVVCCVSCNSRKGDKTPEEAGMVLT